MKEPEMICDRCLCCDSEENAVFIKVDGEWICEECMAEEERKRA
jgi:hypothetical protein